MTAQTVPSKLERARLVVDVADMAGCDLAVAEQVVTHVLRTYGVKEAAKPPEKLVHLAQKLRQGLE